MTDKSESDTSSTSSTAKTPARKSSSPPDSNREARLWRAVIFQALHDAAFGDYTVRREAIAWFTTPRCVEVCDFAGLVPDKMQTLLAQIIRMNDYTQRHWIMSRVRERIFVV